MIKIVILNLLKSLLASVLTEKFLMNLVVILASWLVTKTSNKVDDRVVNALKESMDQQQDGTPVRNLYDQVKSSAPGQAGQ